MTEETTPAEAGWFADVPDDLDACSDAIVDGTADEPRHWPTRAVETGFAESESEYYDRLHEAAVSATRREVRSRERADDQQLIHAVRAMDDCRRTANELAERAAEWAGSVGIDSKPGVAGARDLAAREVDLEPGLEPLSELATRVSELADEADALGEYVERQTPTVAPNLAALAGPVLAARLISLAGGLEALAKQPSGTVQVLGADDALFAHLRGHAPSPKHGIIFTHDAVRGTRREDRGSAARAVAGKLAIAARIDHYSGDRRPELEAELRDRIETIQARADGSNDDVAAEGGDRDE